MAHLYALPPSEGCPASLQTAAVAEAFTALVLLDQYAMHLGCQALRRED
jgi:hypothetical protein